MKLNRFLLLLLSCVLYSYLPTAYGDEQLDDLFEGLPAAKPVEKSEATAEEEILPGEDLDFGAPKDPFARIATKMQRSREALASGKSSEPTQQLQQEILFDLDALLKNMEKKCQGGNCNKPSSASSAASSNAGKKPNPKPGDSTNRVGESNDTQTATSENAADHMKEVWGHLPPKVREAMQNASLEVFLPKYDKLIEDFYRRLAEKP